MPSSDGVFNTRLDGISFPHTIGKVVCVGRNYAEHAKELNNTVPQTPLLFIKPATAVVPFSGELKLQSRFGTHHYETEMALLIGKKLSCCRPEDAQEGIAGLGIGLDLTLRELQNQLKNQGHPWERAKAFDGSCVLSDFVGYDPSMEMQNLDLRLKRNGDWVQNGNTAQMLFPVMALLSEISCCFTLSPGDVVLTGTPKGVGELQAGDILEAELDSLVRATASVAYL